MFSVNEEPTKATDYVADWVSAHRAKIGGTQLSLIRQEDHGRTFCIEFETGKYFLQIRAWDHAYCLDILALNKESGAEEYIVAGDCDGIPGLSARLEGFLQWLIPNETNRNG